MNVHINDMVMKFQNVFTDDWGKCLLLKSFFLMFSDLFMFILLLYSLNVRFYIQKDPIYFDLKVNESKIK